MKAQSRPRKPAHKSVTMWGLASVVAGIAVHIAARNGLDLTGWEGDIAYLLEGVGIVVAGWGRIRPDLSRAVPPRAEKPTAPAAVSPAAAVERRVAVSQPPKPHQLRRKDQP